MLKKVPVFQENFIKSFQDCFKNLSMEFCFEIQMQHESHCSYPSRRRVCFIFYDFYKGEGGLGSKLLCQFLLPKLPIGVGGSWGVSNFVVGALCGGTATLKIRDQDFKNFAKLSSSWLVKCLLELRLALSLIITTPTQTPGKVEMQLESDHIWSVSSW